MTITSVALTTGTQFAIATDGCTGSVAANSYCSITVAFTPTTDGAKSDTVTFAGPGDTAALTGTGVSTPPDAPVASLSSSLAVVLHGSTYTLTWGCTNTPTGATIDGTPVTPAAGGTTSAYTMAATITHTLICTNANGTDQAQVTVTEGGAVAKTGLAITSGTIIQ